MKELKFTTAYARGDRSPEVVQKWNDYCRTRNQKHMNKEYQDPNSNAKAIIAENQSSKRAEKYGSWIDTSDEDKQKRIQIYHSCHKMNLRDGKKTWSVDHIHELALGGPHCSSNLRIVPFSENIIKSLKLNPRRKITRPSQPSNVITRPDQSI
jgi:hypothetical protein